VLINTKCTKYEKQAQEQKCKMTGHIWAAAMGVDTRWACPPHFHQRALLRLTYIVPILYNFYLFSRASWVSKHQKG